MARFLAGAAACFLFITGAFLFWQSRAEQAPLLPSAPQARAAAPSMVVPAVVRAPEASPKTREQKRFERADRNENGRIEIDDLLEPRRKAFARLDKDGNGSLAFEEWAVRTIDKFNDADGDKSKWLTPAEYAATAPKRRPKPKCRC